MRSPIASRSHWATLIRMKRVMRPAAVRVSIWSATETRRPAPLGEVGLDEVAEVHHAAGEAVELGHQERVGPVVLERRQRPLERRAVEGLRAYPLVGLDGHELEVERGAVGAELRPLGVEGALFGLTLGAHSDVAHDPGPRLAGRGGGSGGSGLGAAARGRPPRFGGVSTGRTVPRGGGWAKPKGAFQFRMPRQLSKQSEVATRKVVATF